MLRFASIQSIIGKYLLDPLYQKRALLLICLTLIVVTFGQRHWLLQSRSFDNDEFEHMHSAWMISKGYLPYLDYFEHHTPAMHFLLAQFHRFYEPETDFGDAKGILILSRRVMWLFSGVILILTFALGKTWLSWRVGLLGTVFLVCTLMFQEKTLEIRPDLLSLPCWIGCLAILIKIIQPNSFSEKKRRWLMVACGFLLGSSIMTTQKMLFAMPGFTLAMFIYWFSKPSQGTFQQRFVLILCQLAGFFTPMILMLGYFQIYQGAYAFIEYNLLLNLGWKAGFSPEEYIRKLLEQNPFIVGFGLLGLGWAVIKSLVPVNFQRGDYVMVINLVGLLVGLFIIPVPWRQYYLIFLPILGLFAASFLIQVVDLLISARKSHSPKTSVFALKSILFIILAAVLMIWTFPGNSPVEFSDVIKKSVLLFIIALCLIPVFFRMRDIALAMLIVAVHLPSAKKFRTKFNMSNKDQLSSIQFVIENSPPDATFMDGWKGIGLFRPHAYFYWMLHEEIRGMLSEDQKQQLLEDLKSGNIAPLLVNLDEDLVQLSPDITAFFKQNYQPVGVAELYKRKPI